MILVVGCVGGPACGISGVRPTRPAGQAGDSTCESTKVFQAEQNRTGRRTHKLVEHASDDSLYRRSLHLEQPDAPRGVPAQAREDARVLLLLRFAHPRPAARRRREGRGARGRPLDDRAERPARRDVLAEDVGVQRARGDEVVGVRGAERGGRVQEEQEVRLEDAPAWVRARGTGVRCQMGCARGGGGGGEGGRGEGGGGHGGRTHL